jgi:hypothetical protein
VVGGQFTKCDAGIAYGALFANFEQCDQEISTRAAQA